MEEPNSRQYEEFTNLINEMTDSFSSVRQVIQKLRKDEAALDTKAGISLLSLKHHILLSYLQSLLLVTSRRALGHSLTERTSKTEGGRQAFSDVERDVRGDGAGDLVDSMVEQRVVLEKIRVLEGRMTYQIEKLVKLAREPEGQKQGGEEGEILNDPLAFRPNPQNFMGADGGSGGDSDSSTGDANEDKNDGIYKPPRLAPVPYMDKPSSSNKKSLRTPIPSALRSLPLDPSRPHSESTTGLGSAPNLLSGRAAELKRMKEFEEENFSRLVMGKAEAKRRERDEADLALGSGFGGSGTGGGRYKRRAGGLDDEFGDVLRSIERRGGGRGGREGAGDGYEELRVKGRKGTVLDRSRRTVGNLDEGEGRNGYGEAEEGGRRKKARTRFEMERQSASKRLARARTKSRKT
ncbi:hypothetical protein AMATHDRAFT_5594 [Amanita thiersii Skay4041]|uniref:Neuroguidin n=1 Tax=Amanita thiersii Skay4041 TaxID=703135 RepID=A0A2A9NLQ6_9AGAR|nr:hypothetical protein AMATHDRAFT_5594 [Amanita thiersii Skay4041]